MNDQKTYLLRLYLGAVGVGLFVTTTNILFQNSIGRFINDNILFTYLYTALYIILIEEILIAVKYKEIDRLFLGVAGIFATCIVHFLYQFLDNNVIGQHVPVVGLDAAQGFGHGDQLLLDPHVIRRQVCVDVFLDTPGRYEAMAVLEVFLRFAYPVRD